VNYSPARVVPYAERSERVKKQRALTKDPLQALLATCDDPVAGTPDVAPLLFAWATGGRRRSEVDGATLANLQRVNADAFVYLLRPPPAAPLVSGEVSGVAAAMVCSAAAGIEVVMRRFLRGV